MKYILIGSTWKLFQQSCLHDNGNTNDNDNIDNDNDDNKYNINNNHLGSYSAWYFDDVSQRFIVPCHPGFPAHILCTFSTP